jgi:hypothetical protein
MSGTRSIGQSCGANREGSGPLRDEWTRPVPGPSRPPSRPELADESRKKRATLPGSVTSGDRTRGTLWRDRNLGGNTLRRRSAGERERLTRASYADASAAPVNAGESCSSKTERRLLVAIAFEFETSDTVWFPDRQARREVSRSGRVGPEQLTQRYVQFERNG